MKGQLRVPYHKKLPDSNAYDDRHTASTPFHNRTLSLLPGSILLPQPEPIYEQGVVSVELVRGGILTNVPFPGAHIHASPAGLPSPVINGIHGLYEAPLPGQHVIVGFVEGEAQSPIILNRYPYNPTPNPLLAPAFFLPLTRQAIGITDIVLGHHSGSYIALRGTLPLPGAMDIEATTLMTIKSIAGTTIQSVATVTVTGSIVEIKDYILGVNKITVSGVLNKIDILANPAAGMVNIKPGIGGFLNLGNNPTNFCNNYPNCMFTGLPHSTSLDVKV